MLAIASNLRLHSEPAVRGRLTTARWEAAPPMRTSSAQPNLQCPREPGTRCLPYPAALRSGFGLFCGWASLQSLSLSLQIFPNHPFLQKQASFSLSSRDRDGPNAVGELAQRKGQRHNRAGWTCPGHCAWSCEAAKCPTHGIVSEERKKFSPPSLVGKGK